MVRRHQAAIFVCFEHHSTGEKIAIGTLLDGIIKIQPKASPKTLGNSKFAAAQSTCSAAMEGAAQGLGCFLNDPADRQAGCANSQDP